MKSILLLLSSVVALSGCSSLSALVAPAAQPLEQAATAAAVATAVGSNVKTSYARAQAISNIAKQVLAIDNSPTVLLTDVEGVINAQVAKLNLPAPDVALAQILTASFTVAVQQIVATKTAGAISPTTQVAIKTVCGWVIADAAAYGAN